MTNQNTERRSSDASITRWFHRLQEGDEEAANLLWNHYFPRLVALARNRFDADKDAVYGADDAAQSVLHLLYRGAKDGRFEQVGGRDELWRMLVTSTKRKIIDQARRRTADKRGGDAKNVPLNDEMQSPAPSPESLVILQEQLQLRLDALRDDTLRQIALWRLEGQTNATIASKLRVSERTVERKLRLIREDWSKLD